jgi:prolyl oligopeptidase
MQPETRVEIVVDELHGRRIEDPYRWLEDAESAETLAWTEAQNAYTRSLLDQVPGRETIRRRLEELLSIGVITAPHPSGGRLFSMRRERDQNQLVLYVRDSADGEERVLVDPNGANAEGVLTIDWWYPSRDGRYVAYGLSENGNEWSTLQVIEAENGRLLSERIGRTRYSSVAWLPDSSGFFYTRYPAPGDVPAGEENYHSRPYFHRLGDDPAKDTEIEGVEFQPEDMIGLSVDSAARYLLMSVGKGWDRNDLWIRPLDSQEGFTPLVVEEHALFGAQFAGDTLLIHTNLDAPRYRLLAVDPANPERDTWREIIPEDPEATLDSVTLAGGRIVGSYLRNASSALTLFEPDGSRIADIPLPTLGTVSQVTGEWDSLDAFYAFESFSYPPAIFRLSPTSGESGEWARVEAPIDPSDVTVTQEWYESRDGTRVSMFIVHRADLDLSRPSPAHLTGYGGFNIARTPQFVRGMYLWLEHGGIYALPNLRGGGEYGEAWHRAGMLERKQNVFDDFIAAAEHLCARGYTEPSKLAISGGSNGGLLVGAAMTQRPDLFRAVVCAVPLLDMLRYHRFLIARLWVPEYGSADDPEQFAFIHAYSPYHNVRQGERYPAVLFTTATSDTRVEPLHARKMAARLQAASASERPILIRIESKAGHGAGKPLVKVIDEQTDFWTFLFWQLGVEVEAATSSR